MSLSERQQRFARLVGHLLLKIFTTPGYACTLDWAYRPPEIAAMYAKQGKGVVNSLHCQRLAIDLMLFKDGKYLQDTADYKLFGDYWESLDPLCRWGGKFPKPDGDHFELNAAD